jgi:hypothetical protein
MPPYLIGRVEFSQRNAALERINAVGSTQVKDSLARSAGETEVGMGRYHCVAAKEVKVSKTKFEEQQTKHEWRAYDILDDSKEVGGVGFRHKAFNVEHDGISSTGLVSLNLGQNVVDEIAVMDLAVNTLWGVASQRRGNQSHA